MKTKVKKKKKKTGNARVTVATKHMTSCKIMAC